MKTASGVGNYWLQISIGNVEEVYNALKELDCMFEAEAIYDIQSLLLAYQQYFAGGFFDLSRIKEKCEEITRYAISTQKMIDHGDG